MLARLNTARIVSWPKSVATWVKKHKKISTVLLIIVIVLAIIFRPQPPKALETVTVKSGDITQSLTASGSIQAKNAVTLSFLAGGKVSYIGAVEGDTVKKGQTIASLDQRSAQKSMENAVRDYSKQRNTFEQTKKDNGAAGLDIGSQPEDIRRVLENNQFDLEKAVASVELQDLAKQQSVLTSPINGVLIRSDIPVPGVNAAPTSVFMIADPESLLFNVDVDEADIGKVTEGQTAIVILEAFPEQKIRGTVQSIDFASHKTDTGGNAFTVEVELPIGAASYRIGMNGDAELILEQAQNTLIVPLSAVVDESYVYVKKGDTYEKRTIKIGLQSDTEAQITSGLTQGEEVTIQPDDAASRVK